MDFISWYNKNETYNAINFIVRNPRNSYTLADCQSYSGDKSYDDGNAYAGNKRYWYGNAYTGNKSYNDGNAYTGNKSYWYGDTYTGNKWHNYEYSNFYALKGCK